LGLSIKAAADMPPCKGVLCIMRSYRYKEIRWGFPSCAVYGFLCAALCLLPAAAFSQTAEKLDAVLASEQVSFGQAAGIILPAAGLLSPDAGEGEAFAGASQWLPRGAEGRAAISMGELSFLAMRAFGLSGGFMYRLFPGPRYAYRAMAWRRLLPPDTDPGQAVSGEDLLYITGRLLSLNGDEAAPEGPEPVRSEAAPESSEPVRPDVLPGEGLSSGSEGVIPYEGEFEVE
jgi:hypothetical protein